MLEALTNAVLLITDPLLNWLLYMPRSAAIAVVAILTSLLLTYSRKWAADQEWLARADADIKRLKILTREARKRRDKEAVKRHTMSVNQIKLRSVKHEGKPLLVAILPIALLATWGFSRLGHVPPRDNEPVQIKMYMPPSGIDDFAHILPQPDIQADTGWVQRVKPDTYPEPDGYWEKGTRFVAEWLQIMPPLGGVATWTVRAPARREPYTLQLVYRGEVYEKELIVGRRIYAAQAVLVDLDGPVQATEQMLPIVKPFGVIGGFGPFFPPWLVAYLLIAIPFVSVLKRVANIY